MKKVITWIVKAILSNDDLVLALYQRGVIVNILKNDGSLIPSSPYLEVKRETTPNGDCESL